MSAVDRGGQRTNRGLPTPTLSGVPPEIKALIVSFTAELDNEEHEWAEIDASEDEDEQDDDDDDDTGRVTAAQRTETRRKRARDEINRDDDDDDDSDNYDDDDNDSLQLGEEPPSNLLHLCLVNKDFASLCQPIIWRVSSGPSFLLLNHSLKRLTHSQH